MSKNWSFMLWARQKRLDSSVIDAIMNGWKKNSDNRWPSKAYVKGFFEATRRVHAEMKMAGVTNQADLEEYRKQKKREDKGERVMTRSELQQYLKKKQQEKKDAED